jgi:hypothetical protein
MPDNARARVLFHGAVVLLAGFACGIPSVVETMVGSERMWQASHNGLLLAGVWLIATASALPVLVLPRREARALVVALLATAYGFTTAVLIQAITGERVFSVSRSPILLLAFVGNLVAVLGAFLSTGLILIGARAALKQRTGA